MEFRVADDYGSFEYTDGNEGIIQDEYIYLRYNGIGTLDNYQTIASPVSVSQSDSKINLAEDNDEYYENGTMTLMISAFEDCRITNASGETLIYDGKDYSGSMKVYDDELVGENDPVIKFTVDKSSSVNVSEIEDDKTFTIMADIGGEYSRVDTVNAKSVVLTSEEITIDGNDYAYDITQGKETDEMLAMSVAGTAKGEVTASIDDTLIVNMENASENVYVTAYMEDEDLIEEVPDGVDRIEADVSGDQLQLDTQNSDACSHIWDVCTITTPATCGTAGVMTCKCSACGETKRVSIPATGKHTWSAWRTTKAATASATGSSQRKCSVCGKVETATIAKLKLNTLTIKTYSKSLVFATKARTFSIGTTKAQGKVTYTPNTAAKNAKITVTTAGKVTVPKKCPVGTYTITVKAAGNSTYVAGSKTVTIKITKAANPLKIKVASKTYKRAKLSKKKTFKIGATKAKGKVTYTRNKKAKKAKIKVTAKGKVTVPKKCKKGTYKITVMAKGNTNYKAGSKTVKIVVK